MHSPNAGILAAVLDTLNVAIFVVNEERRPLFANTRAAALLERGRPFHLDQMGSIRITEAADDKALKDTVGALRRARGDCTMRIVPVRAGDHSPAMFAWLSVLPSGRAAASLAGRQISMMVTGRAFNVVGREQLGELFGLTLAESRLARALLQGISPSQYALRQDLSQNTVRNQLKSIFEKTDVRRQSDLVNLIWNVLAPVNFKVSPD
jgi:DNA-binding CsgD family transcriptional regulator